MWGGDWAWWSWGAAAWSEDHAAAVAQAEEWISSTAEARGWSQSDTDRALGVVDEAEAITHSASEFWRLLASLWSKHTWPEGGGQLGGTFDSGHSAAVTTSESRELGSLTTMIADTASATADDLADPRQSWGLWLGAAALLVGVLSWMKR